MAISFSNTFSIAFVIIIMRVSFTQAFGLVVVPVDLMRCLIKFLGMALHLMSGYPSHKAAWPFH